jgi:putative transposase
MVNYRRNFIPGGAFFFTITLADRRSKLLVDQVELLRNALRVARRERPFAIDAIVILPDHLHAIFTLPSGDSDFFRTLATHQGSFQQRVARNFNGVEAQAER